MTQPQAPFLSAEELGIEQWEYNNAVRLLAMLEDTDSGVKIDMMNGHISITSWAYRVLIEKYDCGTPACVGGHIHLMQGTCTAAENDAYVNSRYAHPVLGPLFFPGLDPSLSFTEEDNSRLRAAEADAMTDAAYCATNDQTARALRSTLTTAKSNWRAALEG